MDGLTMLRKLREDEWGSAAKVVVLTSLTANDLTDIKIKFPLILIIF